MPNADLVRQFLDLHHSLVQERDSIQERLAEIDRALGDERPSQGSRAKVLRSGKAAAAVKKDGSNGPVKTRAPRKSGGGLTMKKAVIQVLQGGPKNRKAILEALPGAGFTFKTQNPANSLATCLYTNKDLFQSVKGVFSLKTEPGNTAVPEPETPSAKPAPKRKKATRKKGKGSAEKGLPATDAQAAEPESAKEKTGIVSALTKMLIRS